MRHVEAVHQQPIEALERASVPFYRIVEALNPPRSSSYNPLFQTIVQLLPSAPSGSRENQDLGIGDLVVGSVAIDLWMNADG